MMNSEDNLDSFKFDEAVPEDFEDVEKPKGKIKPGDVEWHDHVMSYFTEHELYSKEYPTLNGLRRVSELLLGQIVNSEVKILNSSLNPDSTARAYCVYSITIFDYLGSRHYRVFNGAADSYIGNTDQSYAIYAVTIAEARAEARALRKALMINVVAAEEIKGNEKSINNGDYNENEPMSEQQNVIIKQKCKQMNINYDTFMNEYPEKITRSQAVEIVKKLSSFQNKVV